MMKKIIPFIACSIIGIALTYAIRLTADIFWAGIVFAILVVITLFTRPDIGIW